MKNDSGSRADRRPRFPRRRGRQKAVPAIMIAGVIVAETAAGGRWARADADGEIAEFWSQAAITAVVVFALTAAIFAVLFSMQVPAGLLRAKLREQFADIPVFSVYGYPSLREYLISRKVVISPAFGTVAVVMRGDGLELWRGLRHPERLTVIRYSEILDVRALEPSVDAIATGIDLRLVGVPSALRLEMLDERWFSSAPADPEVVLVIIEALRASISPSSGWSEGSR